MKALEVRFKCFGLWDKVNRGEATEVFKILRKLAANLVLFCGIYSILRWSVVFVASGKIGKNVGENQGSTGIWNDPLSEINLITLFPLIFVPLWFSSGGGRNLKRTKTSSILGGPKLKDVMHWGNNFYRENFRNFLSSSDLKRIRNGH